MVRTYKPRNRYCRNCKLSEEQFLAVLASYLRFEPATDAARMLKLPRQTVGAHYLKLAKYLDGMPLAGNKQPPFADSPINDPALLKWKRTGDKDDEEAWLKKLWSEAYRNFARKLSHEQYAELRKRDRQPIDKHVWWIICEELWTKWGRIPKSSFRYHFALVKLTTIARENAAGVFMKDYDPILLQDPKVVSQAELFLHRQLADLLSTRAL